MTRATSYTGAKGGLQNEAGNGATPNITCPAEAAKGVEPMQRLVGQANGITPSLLEQQRGAIRGSLGGLEYPDVSKTLGSVLIWSAWSRVLPTSHRLKHHHVVVYLGVDRTD